MGDVNTNHWRNSISKLFSWLLSVACFLYLYFQIKTQTPEGISVFAFLVNIFASVNWAIWLSIMIPYSIFYLLIDTAILWRAITWFNTKVAYKSLLPIRASAYIISILNEQVGKGAIALYLNKRFGVAGWEIGSSMLFIMFCEFFYLLFWAFVGVLIAWYLIPTIFHALPEIAAVSTLFFLFFIFFFRSSYFDSITIRKKAIFKSFRESSLDRYLKIMLMRSPALLAAVIVYSESAMLFGVEIPLIMMLGILPIIFFVALVPGPFRAVAVTMWPTLFPENLAAMTIFGFVQHNFFLLFNASVGLIFLKKVNRDLFRNDMGEIES